MRRPELLLAIDQGTGSSKVLLVDGDGEVIARGSAPLQIAHPRPGWVEQSPEQIVTSVEAAVAACLRNHDRRDIQAIGLSTQRESVLLWERSSGQALGPLISWQDRRTADQCRRLLAQGAGDLVRKRTGLPLDPMFSATKASWLLDAYDPQRQRARQGELCLGTVDSWLLSRFGGDHVIEIGNAARTQLLDVRSGQWDPELLELFNIPPEALPRVVASTGPFARTCGLDVLDDGLPVAAVLGDSHAALFAHAGWHQGRVKATYGTGSSVMAMCPANVSIDAGLCLTIAWQTDADDATSPTLALEGNIRSSGATLTWLSDLVGHSPGHLANLAAAASSDGVHLIPAFNGLGAPWWDDSAHGILTGLTLSTGLPQVARAAFESIAFQVEDVVSAIERVAGPVRLLDADGGASANTHLMQLQADIGGRIVHRARVADLSPLGAAHLAGLATGQWSLADLETLSPPADQFRPNWTESTRRDRLAQWHAALARARYLAGEPEPRGSGISRAP
jgi:glycerol kinase